MRREVYRTVGLRGPNCDATWAPWWRAQATAIHHVALLSSPESAERGARWLARELALADTLEQRE
jgi:hypothetical protein